MSDLTYEQIEIIAGDLIPGDSDTASFVHGVVALRDAILRWQSLSAIEQPALTWEGHGVTGAHVQGFSYHVGEFGNFKIRSGRGYKDEQASLEVNAICKDEDAAKLLAAKIAVVLEQDE